MVSRVYVSHVTEPSGSRYCLAMPRHRLPIALAVVIVVAAVASDAVAQSTRRFTGGPVTLADQGSFFIGGETKISEDATIPGAPPGQTPPPPTPQQITIGQMYSAVPDSRRRSRGRAGR